MSPFLYKTVDPQATKYRGTFRSDARAEILLTFYLHQPSCLVSAAVSGWDGLWHGPSPKTSLDVTYLPWIIGHWLVMMTNYVWRRVAVFMSFVFEFINGSKNVLIGFLWK